MPRQLWLLRHGDAEPHDARPDPERRLTERGEEQARAAGRALAALQIVPESCWSSPKVRAFETARLACAALDLEVIEHAPLASGFDEADARDLLARSSADARVLAVGHEPDFSQVVLDLTGARADVKKGGIAAVRFGDGRPELIVLLRPRELQAIAGVP